MNEMTNDGATNEWILRKWRKRNMKQQRQLTVMSFQRSRVALCIFNWNFAFLHQKADRRFRFKRLPIHINTVNSDQHRKQQQHQLSFWRTKIEFIVKLFANKIYEKPRNNNNNNDDEDEDDESSKNSNNNDGNNNMNDFIIYEVSLPPPPQQHQKQWTMYHYTLFGCDWIGICRKCYSSFLYEANGAIFIIRSFWILMPSKLKI